MIQIVSYNLTTKLDITQLSPLCLSYAQSFVNHAIVIQSMFWKQRLISWLTVILLEVPRASGNFYLIWYPQYQVGVSCVSTAILGCSNSLI